MARNEVSVFPVSDLEDQFTNWIHSAAEVFDQAESLSEIEDAFEASGGSISAKRCLY